MKKQKMTKVKKKESYGLWISWLLLLGIDLSFRGWNWLLHNISGLRLQVNYIMAALALLGLLYFLSFIRKKATFWVVYFLLIALPVILQGNYFIVYKKFISPSEFAVFAGSPRMVLAVGAANLNWLFMLVAGIFLFVSGWFLHRFLSEKRWPMVPAGIAFIGFSVFLTLYWYGVDFFENSNVAFFDNLTREIIVKKEGGQEAHRLKLSPVIKPENPPNLVFVVGESQVLSHMSLYGYPR
jgi:glucan phosphoethanolaminetransferase (alkaline phosphatase superfamily)